METTLANLSTVATACLNGLLDSKQSTSYGDFRKSAKGLFPVET